MKRLPPRSAWTYRRLTHPCGVEVSDWQGVRSPFLSAHLHDEAQLSIVYSGLRRFGIGEEVFSVPAGSFIVIPAGVPHMSVGVGGVKTCSRDIFLSPDWAWSRSAAHVLLGEAPFPLTSAQDIDTDSLLNSLSRTDLLRKALRLERKLPAAVVEAVRCGNDSVAEIAREVGLSREGFIRKFAREIGMTPYAYRVAHRASRARAMLRREYAPAEAAQDAGFADQSHLGRVFRRNFGTTPAAYARVWRAQ